MDKTVLVAHNGNTIVLWLVGEPMESLPNHLKNGYPKLVQSELHAEVISVPEEDAFASEKYEVKNNAVQRKEGVV
jgi:hypothetical protein